MNTTHEKPLEEIAGDCDLEDLPGVRIELYKEQVAFQGKSVDAVRLRRPQADGTAADEMIEF